MEQAVSELVQIGGLPIFKDLSQKELKEVLKAFRVEVAQPGQVIFEEGSKGDCLYAILRGKVEIKMRGPHPGEQPIIATLTPGAVLGESSLLTDETRSATAIAVEESQFLCLNKEVFEQFINSDDSLGNRLLHNLARILAQRLRMVDEQLVELMSHREGGKPQAELALLKKKLFTEWSI